MPIELDLVCACPRAQQIQASGSQAHGASGIWIDVCLSQRGTQCKEANNLNPPTAAHHSNQLPFTRLSSKSICQFVFCGPFWVKL